MLRRLYDDESFKDITFKLDSGNTFRAHRCILTVSTVEYFRVILKSAFKEATESIIKIEDCSDKVFEIALLWAYEIFDNRNSIEDVFIAADRFLIPSLIQHYADHKGDIKSYIDFLFEMMKYPMAFRDILKGLRVMDLFNINRILTLPAYRDRAESVILFMLQNCNLETNVAARFLQDWLNPQIINDKIFGKSPLDMREITILLLKKGMFMRPAALQETVFKNACKRLVDKGYYRQEDIDKLYKEESRPYFIVSSYPLKIGKLIPIDKALRAHEKILFMFNSNTKQRIKTYFPELGVEGYYNVVEI